jgi:hypothetical protein
MGSGAYRAWQAPGLTYLPRPYCSTVADAPPMPTLSAPLEVEPQPEKSQVEPLPYAARSVERGRRRGPSGWVGSLGRLSQGQHKRGASPFPR